MEFTINWSPPAQDLLRAGKIKIDRFKCPNWDDMIADAREDAPIYVHFPLAIGRNMLVDRNWAAIEAIRADTDTPFINLHLEPLREAVGDLDDAALIEYCIAEIRAVVDRFGGENVVVENVPYFRHQTDRFEAAVQPQNIAQIIREAGARFLFDIGHARIAADTLGIDAQTYIQALPLERLGELHVTGVVAFDQTVEDTIQQAGLGELLDQQRAYYQTGRLMDHFGMENDEDWRSFEWVMELIRDGRAATPRLVSFEYGGTGNPFAWRSESSVIARDVPRFYQLVHG